LAPSLEKPNVWRDARIAHEVPQNGADHRLSAGSDAPRCGPDPSHFAGPGTLAALALSATAAASCSGRHSSGGAFSTKRHCLQNVAAIRRFPTRRRTARFQ
jgi:hypothetical protein